MHGELLAGSFTLLLALLLYLGGERGFGSQGGILTCLTAATQGAGPEVGSGCGGYKELKF